ncbi:MAG: YfhO family protein, partial [Clostridia bacterium]|nr:YfhO family protein [Clostridia bacterium]
MSKTNILKKGAPTLQDRGKNRFTAFLWRNIFIISTFLVSFILMTLAFGLMNVSPFGTADKQIMVVDNWHQYYPFLADYQYKLQHGESLFWNWSVGAGVNNFALMSYYLASPLNLLTVFLPAEWLREFLMFSVVLKIALGGTFTAYFLRSVYKRNDISLVLFGTSFSFCAFFMGYYWNTIWLDTVCITPLVALGAYMLLKEGNFRLYTVTLAISLLANYYIGFFTCIFMLLIFIVYHILHWDGIKKFGFNILKMGVFSAIAIGLTAFFLLPAFFGLQNTNSSDSSFPADFAINIGGSNDLAGVLRALKYIVANLVNFSCAATKAADAIPNISCGAISIFFGMLFFTSKKISLKEKIVDFSLVLFMFLSCIIRWLDYMWHGFHFTNMIPYRFS